MSTLKPLIIDKIYYKCYYLVMVMKDLITELEESLPLNRMNILADYFHKEWLNGYNQCLIDIKTEETRGRKKKMKKVNEDEQE